MKQNKNKAEITSPELKLALLEKLVQSSRNQSMMGDVIPA